MTNTNAPIQLVLLGHGKMGRLIEQLAPDRGFAVRAVLDEFSNAGGQGITPQAFQGVEVCIDFTAPDVVMENIGRVARLGCNLVVGTTGWVSHLDEVRSLVKQAGIGMVYGANFAIGVQLFYRAAEAAAQIFSAFPQYSPFISETHHRFKKDAPSGTAIELRQRVEPWCAQAPVAVSSIRGGYAPGTHELVFDSEGDTVTLQHNARGRQGFAEGALHAARWVAGKKGLYTFAEVIAQQFAQTAEARGTQA